MTKMKWKVYMLEDQGSFKTEEEANKRKKGLEGIYKGIKFEVRGE